jgi:MSHA pilin protein MshC
LNRLPHGYTMVELITVMIVVGILAAIAIPRITNTDEFTSNAYRNEVASALRHAQKSAVSHRRVVCATLAPSTITLKIATAVASTNCNEDYRSPDGSLYTSRNSSIVASGAFIGKRLLFFPNGEIRVDTAGTPFATGSVGIAGQAAIQIDGSTGYVQ